MTAPVVVCGFPGAGKTELVSRLRAAGVEASELDGLMAPNSVNSAPVARVIAVADCANMPGQWRDHLVGPLLRRQFGAAHLVVLSRTDIADPAPVEAILREVTQRPVIDAPAVVEALAGLEPAPLGPQQPEDDVTPKFHSWNYDGPAKLMLDRIDPVLESRPSGIVRMSGQIRTDKGGVEVEIAGRVRQTCAIRPPVQTSLTAIGPVEGMCRNELDLWFAEAVAASTSARGVFSYR